MVCWICRAGASAECLRCKRWICNEHTMHANHGSGVSVAQGCPGTGRAGTQLHCAKCGMECETRGKEAEARWHVEVEEMHRRSEQERRAEEARRQAEKDRERTVMIVVLIVVVVGVGLIARACSH